MRGSAVRPLLPDALGLLLCSAGCDADAPLSADEVPNVKSSEVSHDRRPGEAPRVDDTEIDALVAFLQTLTDRSE